MSILIWLYIYTTCNDPLASIPLGPKPPPLAWRSSSPHDWFPGAILPRWDTPRPGSRRRPPWSPARGASWNGTPADRLAKRRWKMEQIAEKIWTNWGKLLDIKKKNNPMYLIKNMYLDLTSSDIWIWGIWPSNNNIWRGLTIDNSLSSNIHGNWDISWGDYQENMEMFTAK